MRFYKCRENTKRPFAQPKIFHNFASSFNFIINLFICEIMAEHNDLGLLGEEKAVEYLSAKGYKIRHRNWRSGKLELDIVAEKEGTLVVVEVRTRRDNYLLAPAETVNKTKMRNTIMAAEAYIFKFNIMMPTQFDILSVVVGAQNSSFKIEHIEDAFLP